MDKVLVLTGFAVHVLDFLRPSCPSITVTGVLRSGGLLQGEPSQLTAGKGNIQGLQGSPKKQLE